MSSNDMGFDPTHGRVVVVSDGKDGPLATQRISFSQPFATSGGSDGRVEIFHAPRLRRKAEITASFTELRPNLLVLSRYTGANGLLWIEMARTKGLPVIYHIDDDLLEVPKSLGEEKYRAYNAPERLAALRANMEASDLVYASTPELANRLAEHQIKTPIVAGDIYCSIEPNDVGATHPLATGPVIGYMGTGGHSQDLEMILPSVIQIMERVPALQFELFGTINMPPELARFGNRVRHLPPVADYAEFVSFLRALGWWVGLAPLEDNAFNRCKADTKWVEYSMADIAVVASDLPVYHRACAGGSGILAGDSSTWFAAITGLLENPTMRTAQVAAATKKLREHYSHAALRDQVMNIFLRAQAEPRDVV